MMVIHDRGQQWLQLVSLCWQETLKHEWLNGQFEWINSVWFTMCTNGPWQCLILGRQQQKWLWFLADNGSVLLSCKNGEQRSTCSSLNLFAPCKLHCRKNANNLASSARWEPARGCDRFGISHWNLRSNNCWRLTVDELLTVDGRLVVGWWLIVWLVY